MGDLATNRICGCKAARDGYTQGFEIYDKLLVVLVLLIPLLVRVSQTLARESVLCRSERLELDTGHVAWSPFGSRCR